MICEKTVPWQPCSSSEGARSEAYGQIVSGWSSQDSVETLSPRLWAASNWSGPHAAEMTVAAS
jgi:hypothetical protein